MSDENREQGTPPQGIEPVAPQQKPGYRDAGNDPELDDTVDEGDDILDSTTPLDPDEEEAPGRDAGADEPDDEGE